MDCWLKVPKLPFLIDRSDFIKDRKTFFFTQSILFKAHTALFSCIFSGMLEINCAVKVVNCCQA